MGNFQTLKGLQQANGTIELNAGRWRGPGQWGWASGLCPRPEGTMRLRQETTDRRVSFANCGRGRGSGPGLCSSEAWVLGLEVGSAAQWLLGGHRGHVRLLA